MPRIIKKFHIIYSGNLIMELLGLNFFLSLVVGLLGRKTIIGFWGNFIFSLFLTPIVPLIYILIATNKGKKAHISLTK